MNTFTALAYVLAASVYLVMAAYVAGVYYSKSRSIPDSVLCGLLWGIAAVLWFAFLPILAVLKAFETGFRSYQDSKNAQAVAAEIARSLEAVQVHPLSGPPGC